MKHQPKPKPKRPSVHRTPRDGEPHGYKVHKGQRVEKSKTYPNGIQVTFGGLWQYWWEHADPPVAREGFPAETSAEEFAELFDIVSKALELKKKYPDLVPPGTPKAAGEAFQEIGNGTCVELDYFSLRWAAELVDLPVGLFILFTHLVSRERRLSKRVTSGELTVAEKKDGLTNLAEQISAFAEKVREIIEDGPDAEGIFYEEFPPQAIKKPKKNDLRDGETAYLARMSVLKRLVDATQSVKRYK